jgi:hypothetical protein
MSRGPGRVMQGVTAAVESLDPDQGYTYVGLARLIYGATTPTGAQLSAISRAVAHLEAVGTVTVEKWYADERVSLVLNNRWR